MRTEVEVTLGGDGQVLEEFMACRERVSFIMGPLGSGKTYAALQRILDQMCEQEPNAQGERRTRWVAVRNTYPDLTTTTIRDFEEVFRGLGVLKMSQPPQFDCNFGLEDGTLVKAEVIFLALDREDAIRKIRGLQITGAWLNETKELEKAVVDMLDLRIGRYPSMAAGGVRPTWFGMLGDTNAPDESHWYARLSEEPPQGWRFFRQPGGVLRQGDAWVANPDAENLKHLPPGYYERGVLGKADDWISVMLSNEYGFTVDGKPVHPEYQDSVHCPGKLEPDPRWPLILGVDFGRTPACAISQFIEPLGRHVFLDEFYTDDMSASLFAPELKRHLDAHYPNHRLAAFGDPAGDRSGQTVEITPIQLLREAGIPCQPAPTNKPVLRRKALAGPATRLCMDGKPALLVSSNCMRLRKGLMGGFHYRRLKVPGSERYTEEPDKNEYSHIVEAAEYAALGSGELHVARDRSHVTQRNRIRQRWAE